MRAFITASASVVLLACSAATGQVPSTQKPCTELLTFSDPELPGYSRVYRYDERGTLLERVTDYGDEVERDVYDYDDAGRIETEATYRDGLLAMRTRHAYDARGRLRTSEIDGRDEEGEDIMERTTYEYDADGRLVAEHWDADRDGAIDSQTRYTYDERGRLLMSETLTPSDVVVGRVRYLYDDSEHPDRITGMERDLGSVSGVDGDVDSGVTLIYDELGRLVEERTQGALPSVLTYGYACWP